jgi:isopentenyldiphosphate isomerase
MLKNNPEPSDELLRCFDEAEKEIEPRTRQWLWDHPNVGSLHGIGSVWIINPRGEVLCSKRSENLKSNPGRWQTYFGGKVPVGETPKQTAIRELSEEIDIKASENNLFSVKETQRIGRYVYPHDADATSFGFPDGEITEVKWMTFEKIKESEKKQPELWCNLIAPEYEDTLLKLLGSKRIVG